MKNKGQAGTALLAKVWELKDAANSARFAAAQAESGRRQNYEIEINQILSQT